MASEKYRKEGKHLTLKTLKEELIRENIYHKCIMKENIPAYPRPELHVSHISHSTDLQSLWGIEEDGGFRNPTNRQAIWFSLTVSPDELKKAENRNMTLVYPGGEEKPFRPERRPQAGPEDRPEEDPEERGGQVEGAGPVDEALEGALPEGGKLQDFATSPSFRSRFRYGSFRFTFSLRDVLEKYSQQFCEGKKPVLRVLRTVLYSMEVMYAVLVHSPNKKFSHLPLLEESSICEFRENPEPHFVWRPEAMSETHCFGLKENNGTFCTQEVVYEFYVWDHVALALYVGDELLEFAEHELRENLRFCEQDDVTVPKDRWISYQSFEEAEREVRELWPDHHLQKFKESHFHIND